MVRETDGSNTTYLIVELTWFAEDQGGKLVLLGLGTEKSQKVEARRTLEVTQQSPSILPEARLPGEEFKFRHQYRFSRSSQKNLPHSKP